MAIQQPLFINSFQKGSQENANIGFGSFVGVETYTQKGIAKLTRDTTKKSGSVVTGKPISFTNTSNIYLAQDNNGRVYRSIDYGDTWTNITGALPLGAGDGIILYQGYAFAFNGGDIYYNASPYNSGGWTFWKQYNGSRPAVPFLFPNDGAVYFASGNQVGKIYFGTATSFNPAGSGTSTITYSGLTGGTFAVGDKITTNDGGTGKVITDNGVNSMTASINGNFAPSIKFDNGKGVSATVVTSTGTGYFYSNNWLTLPSNYTVQCISFLPSNFLALGTGSFSDTQICDLFLWNPTLSTYETPLRLYSTGDQGDTGIKQIINRNNTLYAVTGGNMCLFSTNGTTFQLIEDFSLRTSWRLSGGAQTNFPVFLDPNPKAIAVLGNKILLGTSTGDPNTGIGSPYGLFPMGVWTCSFTDGGMAGVSAGSSFATQLEFPISTGTIRTSGFNNFSIGAVYAIDANRALIGWADNGTFGIDKINLDDFQNDINTVIVESSLMEIGTPLTPATVQNIELFLVNDLLTDQTIRVYGRKKLSDDYTLLQTFTPSVDGSQSQYSVVKNSLGPTQYIQIKIQMSTGGSNTKYTPLLRNVLIR